MNIKKENSFGVKMAYIAFILLPFVIMGFVIHWFWVHGMDWVSVLLYVFMHLLTTFGVTVFYHRYFTHKSFEIKVPWLENAGAVAGMMAVEGPVIVWAETHIKHHDCSDEKEDPHTPHGYRNMFIGFLRAHFFIIWYTPAEGDDKRYVSVHRKNPTIMRLNNLFFLWAVLGFIVPALVGAGLRMSFTLFFIDVMVQVCRMVTVHHITWCINSICHIWGWQPFKTGDESRNNPLVALFSCGEGWHNNHHKFQYSAKHGLLPWQFDPSYMVICLFKIFRLIDKVRVPSQETIKKGLAQSSTTNA